MTDDTARHVAADVLGAMTDDEFAAFVSEARVAAPPQLTPAVPAGNGPRVTTKTTTRTRGNTIK